MADFETFRVQPADRGPLREFIKNSLAAEGARIIYESPENEAPFRFTFETPGGERLGIVVYAFLANQKATKNRPEDEHRFQVKYGSKAGQMHEVWQDPFGLYVTLFCGINPDLGIFVGADPWLHNPTKFFISIEFKDEHVERIVKDGWYAWERHRRKKGAPVEVLVGGTAKSFLRYVRFEREALREDQGHRQLLAEKAGKNAILALPERGLTLPRQPSLVLAPSSERVHTLAREFDLNDAEVLDLIARARMLKMAVRGYVAEEHLVRRLVSVPGVSGAQHAEEEGGPDVLVTFEGEPIRVECKNALRQKSAAGEPRVDFQRTRASKKDPCSRYYRPEEFDLVAACLHAVTEQWEFQYAIPRTLDAHKKCPGRLSNNVRVSGERWMDDAARALRAAAGVA